MVTLNMYEEIKEITGAGRIRGKVWAKKITAVDVSKQNGYAFEGEFLSAYDQLADFDVGEGDVVLMYCVHGSAKHPHVYAALVVFKRGGFEIVKLVTGYDYVIKLRDTAAELLQQEKPSPLAGFSTSELLAEMWRRGNGEVKA